MKKKTNKLPANRCTSTVSSGALACVLERDHEGVHTTSTGGRKAGQYATWSAAPDGTIRVITYSSGKKMGEWPEEPAAQNLKPCTAEDARGRACSKVAGHDGEHHNATGWAEPHPSGAPPSALEFTNGLGEQVVLNESEGRYENKGKAKPAKALDSNSRLVRAHRKKQAEARKAEADRKKPRPAAVSRFCDDREAGPGSNTSSLCELQPGHDGDHRSGAKAWPRRDEAPPPRPITLEDEPEDPEADADAVAALDEQGSDELGDELFSADNADRWWWGYRGQTGMIIANKYTGDMAPVLDARAHPLIGSTVVGPFLLAVGENTEQAERRIREVIAEPGEREEPEESDADARWYCEAPFRDLDGRERKCEGRTDHNGPHYVFCKVQNRTVFDASNETCNVVALHDDEWCCAKLKGHDGSHQSELVIGGSVAVWSIDDGVEQGAVRKVGARGKVAPAIVESWSHPVTKEAEEQIEEQPAPCGAMDGKKGGACIHPAGHEGAHSNGKRTWRDPKPEPSLTDACPKCGRELGEHDGKKCPKPTKTRTALPASATILDTPPDLQRVSETDEQTRDRLKRQLDASGPRILGYRRHPAAALFPLLEGAELASLGDSIATNGLRDPIVRVTVGGETYILDGSNRGVACEQRGIQPRFVDYEGPKDTASLIAYSLDKNGDGRRHLDPSVRAMIVVEASKLMPRGNPGDRETGRSAGLLTQAEAGKRMGVSDRLVRRAKVVRDNATAKVIEAVKKGKLAVDAAEQVSKLSEAKQNEIADEALAKKHGQVRTGRIKALVRQEEKRSIVRKINEQRVGPMPTGEFGVIYADYPWKFDNSDQHEGSRGHLPYPPMTLDEIIAHAHEAKKRAAKNCVLVLWTTNHHVVTQVGRVVEAYGATQPTTFTWPKSKAGIGSSGRGQTEQLVVAFIGKPVHTLNEISTLLPSWAPAHPGEHSSKPAEVAELLLKHCSGPFLELFAREEREGFVCWGAEVDKFASEAA
jgi:N6-adenosine-specific RNA methylase IME4